MSRRSSASVRLGAPIHAEAGAARWAQEASDHEASALAMASCLDVRPGQQQGLPRPQPLQKTARALFGALALDPGTLSARPQPEHGVADVGLGGSDTGARATTRQSGLKLIRRCRMTSGASGSLPSITPVRCGRGRAGVSCFASVGRRSQAPWIAFGCVQIPNVVALVKPLLGTESDLSYVRGSAA
jgi:hypothetical protein